MIQKKDLSWIIVIDFAIMLLLRGGLTAGLHALADALYTVQVG